MTPEIPSPAARPLRVLLLIIQFPPDVNSTGLLMEQVCDGLVERGHAVSVLTTFPHYAEFRVWDQYRGRLVERARHRDMEVTRLWVYASGRKQRMLHRLFSYLSFSALATAARLLDRRRFDVVLCTNGSFFSGFAAYLGGAPRRVPFVYNVQDLYPDTPVAAGQLRGRRTIAALERMERFMYRKAAHVSVITPAFRDNLLGKGVPPEKVSVIPNFVDTDFIRPLPRDNDFSRRHRLDGRFVVSHAGNVGYVYDLGTMLEAAALLRDEPELLFLIVGEGVARPDLERQAARLELSNVRFLPFQPREDLPWLRASSDAQVSLYRPESGRYSMPSKLYEIMASGRPLLASANVDSDVRRLVDATECGLFVPPGDAPALADAVLALRRDPGLRERMGVRGREAACAEYSKESVVDRYEALLRRVAARPKRPRVLRTSARIDQTWVVETLAGEC